MSTSELVSLNLVRLHHSEFGQFIKRFFEDFAQTNLNADNDADFKRLYDALQAQLPAFNSALNQIKASEESEAIAKLDALRDAALQNLRNALKPYRNSEEEAEINAHKALSLLLAEYKETHDASFEAETNELTELTSRLESADYSSHVTELNIEKFVTRIKNANVAFNDLFSQRSFKTSQKEVYDVKALRKTLAEEYKTMVNYIASNAPVKQDAFYKDVLGIINNGRTYFSTVVLSRRAGKKLPAQEQ